jgi:polyisoprenoid-binding protein YceI
MDLRLDRQASVAALAPGLPVVVSHMKTVLAAAALLAVLVAPAVADATLAPDDIQPGTYAIDTKETLVRYGVLHMGFSDYWGTFPGATGTLVIDPKHISDAKVDVKVPIVGVETTNRELNEELFSDEFMDGEKFKAMHFVSTAVTRTGPRTAKVAGDLTVHGITKPIVLNVTFVGAGGNAFSNVPTVGFRAEGVVKRSDFGMAKFVPIVSDETTIFISVAFEKHDA